MASMEKKTAIQRVDSCFLFAAIWSICVTITSDCRRKFDMHMKKVCEGSYEGVLKFNNKKLLPAIFDKGLVYDYVYFPEEDNWQHWMDLTNKDEIDNFPREAIVQDIVVTTVDTIRYSYIQEHCITHEIPTLFVGPTGTGKSCYIQDVLLNKLDRAKYNTIEIGFSAQTHCNQVQEIVDGKLDKRRQGVFGARLGQKMIIFVDDLNMPKLEEYGAQPPIELLRQMLKQGGWYDLKDPKHPFRTFIDTMLICAMGPPGGGKTFITPRMQRHLNVVGFALFEDKTMKGIFGSILRWFFRVGDFAPECAALEAKLVDATLQIYKQIQEELKPTPAKSHYTFNLRDFSKIICGICLVTKKEVETPDRLMRLWAHETTRVLGDRLINDEDRMWMLNTVKETIKQPFGQNFDLLFKHLDLDMNGKIETLDEYRGLIFGDIFTPYGMRDRPYEEIQDKARL